MKTRTLALFAALLVCLPLFAQKKRAFTLEDLYRVKTVGGLTINHDGTRAAYTIATSDLGRAKRTTVIWIMNADGSGQRQITRGDADTSPAFSPDGHTLAFIRSDNIYLLPIAGGEARQLTKFSTGVADPIWSPDGKWIAFSSDVFPECNADDACNKKLSDRVEEGKLKAHVTDELLYRHWTSWRDFKYTHTFVVNVESGDIRDLTPGKQDFPAFQLSGSAQYAFSPDSKEIAISSNPDKQRASSTNNDIYVISLKEGSTPRNITDSNKAYDGTPRYSPDGRFIAYRLQKQPAYESDLFRLGIYDRNSGTTKVLTESFKNWIDDFQWSADSKWIYFSGEVEGRNPIYRLGVSSSEIKQVLVKDTIDQYELAEEESSFFLITRSVGKPPEIFTGMIDGDNVSLRQVTHVNDDFLNEVDVRPAETMWVTGADGVKVQVFIVKPHDFDATKKYPLILNVHGGPQSQWSDAFRGDWQVYPGAGYVVAFANPHGSTGFGQDYTASISGDWGGRPFEDLMKVTDALEKLPYVDKNRMAAMGWSYGGYMMNWFEGHTDRFKAIASMMGLYDLRSFYGATEELWFPEWDLKGQPWSSTLYEKWSPSNSAKNFKTPCLVITGERDYRVPYTQGLQMFTALQKMNVPSRLIVYSNAGHWPSWYEMALYYTAHLEWFHQYLGGGEAPWTSEQFVRSQVFDPESGKRREPEKAPEVTQGKPDVKPQ